MREGSRYVRPKIEQPPFIENGERMGNASGLREFGQDGHAMPPFPCMLCEKDFATRETFLTHVQACHCGISEYRKRVFWLSRELGRPVRPT